MGGYDKQRCCRREGGGGSQWVGMINRDVVEREGGGGSQWVGMINRDVVEGRVVEEVSGWV